MVLTLNASLAAAALFICLLLALAVGRRVGKVQMARDPEGFTRGNGAVEGAVFGLLGLLIAFTFSGAALRFEERRHLITDEANAIGTAYLRIDLLPAGVQPDMKALFQRYLDIRIQTFQQGGNLDAAYAKLAEANALQTQIWNRALAALRLPESTTQASMLLIPALNEMFDISTTRTATTRNHPPLIIFLLLAGFSSAAALLAGYSMADSHGGHRLHMAIFAAVMAVTLYVIIDIEYPRLGLIRVDGADAVLIELRQSMTP